MPAHPSLGRLFRFATIPTLLAALALIPMAEGPPPSRAAEDARDEARQKKDDKSPRFVDLSLLAAVDHPCAWPTFPQFQIIHYQKIGPLGAYNSDILMLDGNTGTQLDVPPHSVTPPKSGLANAGPFGLSFTDKIAAWQFGGEACVIDCKDLLDTAPKGRSDLIKKERLLAWEKKHRKLGPGDVVLFHSGWSDKYYKPLPEGPASPRTRSL